jgi:aurora kinase
MLEGGSYNSEIDVWAIGVLAFELLTGRPPFYHSSRQMTIKNIQKGDLEMPKGLSLNAQVFLGKTLERKASERVGIGLLLADRFVQEWIYRG